MSDKNHKISNGMKIITVIPLEKGSWKADLTYFSLKDVKNGSIVSVPIRNKKILSLVISSDDVREAKESIKNMSFKLKKIIEVKNRSIFKKEFLESTFLLSSYFVSKKNSAVISLIPAIFRERYNELEKFSFGNNFTSKEEEKFDSPIIKNEKLLFQASLEDRISYYKTLIRGQFALKKSVFIILPTERDIKLFEQSLSKGIENFIFSIYGNLKPKKIIDLYKKIINEHHGVLILGTAQFLSIPREDIGTIIVEHESSNVYKMIPEPHFDLRIFAEIYAYKIKAKFILADTLLRYETIARKEIENLSEIHPMSFRTNLNEISINIKNPNDKNKEEQKDQNKKIFKIFGSESIEEIENTLKNKKNVFIFSLRKGLATYTICRDCGESINCENCLAPLVLYLSRDAKKRMFVCNKCHTEKNPETTCANCGSWNLMPLGIGTDTIYQEIKNKFSFDHRSTSKAKTKIFKLDKESVKSGKDAKKIIEEFEKTPSGILVATEMAFSYLNDKVALSVIASFDGLWTIPNFKMSEKIIQLLFSILSYTERKLIIQTKNDSDKALLALKSGNLLSFIREELEDRKNLNYPPYKRFIKIVYLGDKESSKEAKKNLKKLLESYNPEIFGRFIAKNKDKYITNALIRVEPSKWSLPELLPNSSIDQNLKNLLFSLSDEYKVSIDPEDLL